IAQIREGADDPVVAPRAILPRHAYHEGLNLRVDHGTTGSLALGGTIKFLGYELAVPGQDRRGLDETCHSPQGLFPQLLTDLGQPLTFAVRQSHTTRDLAAQDAIFRHRILVAQEEL